MLPIGSHVYFYSHRDQDYFVGVFNSYAVNKKHYVLSGCVSVDGLTHYYNTTYVSIDKGFESLDDAKKDRMIKRLKNYDK